MNPTPNELLQIEHEWWSVQINQQWQQQRENPAKELLDIFNGILPARPPMSFILHWHNPKRWPMVVRKTGRVAL